MRIDILDELSDIRNTEEIPEIGEDEVKAAIAKMKLGKAPGADNIAAEELVAATQRTGLKIIHKLYLRVWEEEELSTI